MIENMTAAEIKAQRAELAVEAAASASALTVAERYVQARMDAKARDELLAIQGKELTEQQHMVAECRKLIEQQTAVGEEARRQLLRQQDVIDSLNLRIGELSHDNAALRAALTAKAGELTMALNQRDEAQRLLREQAEAKAEAEATTPDEVTDDRAG